ncbi:conserved hypothetical protein [Cenarchaeum symbiosum A]|uniref:Uncharacterized protein n=1 Tax=Cenarchaeum symbiosum (strain A) TaxID=414004 RepID=A0RX92_CENSY|nr:conserved hypothetical protein [Cenarchaeum symbiosum A]
MVEPELGAAMAHLKQRIRQIREEIDSLEEPRDVPGMIQSANLIRSNEHLSVKDRKKSELLAAYDEYAGQLESLVSTVFGIRDELKEILKEQSALIARSGASKSGD